MEFEDLKAIWHQHATALKEQEYRSLDDIRLMLRQRSQGALASINRNIGIEVIMLLGLGLISLRLMTHSQPLWRPISMGMAGFVVLALAFYGWKYRRLNQVALRSGNLRMALEESVEILGQYMQLYVALSVSLVPLLGGSGVLYGLYVGAEEQGESLLSLSNNSWALVAGVSVLYIILSVWFSRWYVQRLYGVHYQELQSCLAELQEQQAA